MTSATLSPAANHPGPGLAGVGRLASAIRDVRLAARAITIRARSEVRRIGAIPVAASAACRMAERFSGRATGGIPTSGDPSAP